MFYFPFFYYLKRFCSDISKMNFRLMGFPFPLSRCYDFPSILNEFQRHFTLSIHLFMNFPIISAVLSLCSHPLPLKLLSIANRNQFSNRSKWSYLGISHFHMSLLWVYLIIWRMRMFFICFSFFFIFFLCRSIIWDQPTAETWATLKVCGLQGGDTQ